MDAGARWTVDTAFATLVDIFIPVASLHTVLQERIVATPPEGTYRDDDVPWDDISIPPGSHPG